MREPAHLSRRALVAALPIGLLAGATPLAIAAVVPRPCPGIAEVDAAAHRCSATRQALDDALAAYERALPAPHFTLDMTGGKTAARKRWTFTAVAECRLVDGKAPNRATDVLGRPDARYVATVETIERDLLYRADEREHRKLLHRMYRRARVRAAEIAALEASFRLEELRVEVAAAERAFDALIQKLFEGPAASMAAALVQAKALSAYASAVKAPHVQYQAGRFGQVLADGLQHVARAA